MNIVCDNENMLKEIPNLTKRCEIMSNENLGSYIGEIASYFTNKLVDLKNSLLSSTTHVDENNVSDTLILMTDLKQDMLYIIEHAKYTEYSSVKIPSILGLQLNLLDATSELNVMFKLVNDNILDVLNDLDTTVSKVMSDKNYRISTRPVNTRYDISDMNIKIHKGITKIIDGNGTRDIYKLSELIPNMKSINLVYDDLVNMSKNTGVSNMINVKLQTTKLSSKIDTLYHILKDNKEMEISKVVLNNISYQLEETAILVSNYVSVLYIYNQIISTNTAIIKRIRTSIM